MNEFGTTGCSRLLGYCLILPSIMKTISSLALARRGDHHAIATVLNKYLQVNGYGVDVSKRRWGLSLTIESEEVPPQTKVVAFVEICLTKIQPQGIKQVMVCGRAAGCRVTWQERLQLDPPAAATAALGKKVRYRRRSEAVRGVGKGLLMTLMSAIVGVGLWQTQRTQPSPWEYHLARVDASLLETTLKEFGAQGWELGEAPRPIWVSDQRQAIYEVIFKRPASTPLNSPDFWGLASFREPAPLAMAAKTTKDISADIDLDRTGRGLSNQGLGDIIYYQTLNGQGEPVTRTAILRVEGSLEHYKQEALPQSDEPPAPPLLSVPHGPIPLATPTLSPQ